MILLFKESQFKEAYEQIFNLINWGFGEIVIVGPSYKYIESVADVVYNQTFPNSHFYETDRIVFDYQKGLKVKFISGLQENRICGYRPRCLIVLSSDTLPEVTNNCILGMASVQ